MREIMCIKCRKLLEIPKSWVCPYCDKYWFIYINEDKIEKEEWIKRNEI